MIDRTNAPPPAASLPYGDQIPLLWIDSIAWVTSHSLQIIIGAAFAAVIVAVLMGVKTLGLRLCRSDADHTHWRTTIGRAFATTKLWFMVAVAAELVAGYAQAPGAVFSTIRFAFVVASALQGALWAREIILGIVEHRAGGDGDHGTIDSAIGIIRLLVTIALFAIAIILILDNLGVNVTGLVAGLGIGGIAIGLAAQGIFSDLFAALSIIFDKPFHRGQQIRFGDATGRVEAIGLKTTRVRSVDGEQVIISNAKLLDQQIRNMADVRERRVLLTLPLTYANDPDTLALLPDELKAIVSAEKKCRFDHALLLDFGASAINLELMFHVQSADVETTNAARHRVMIGALRRLRELDVQFNYPPPPPIPEEKTAANPAPQLT
jgi:small-conductance mechanosensitive channel